MRIVHVSDSHIGYSAYAKVEEESGLNLREMDVFRSFQAFVDKVLEIRPDAVLHSGDLFDSVRPTNRAISFALEQLIRIAEEGIPVVVIAGNHSTPRLRETGSVFRIFEHVDGIFPVYKGEYEKVMVGDMAVHAIPHCETEPLRAGLESASLYRGAKYDVGLLHAGVVGLGVFKMDEFNEVLIQSSYLSEELDYIALGHYHDRCEVAGNAWYAGSTERFSFAEAGQRKGFLVIDLADGGKEFVDLPTRGMLDLPPLDALRMDAGSLREGISQALESNDLIGKVARLRIKNLRSSLYKTLDFNGIREATRPAAHFELKYDIVQEGTSVQSSGATISSLNREFVSFLERRPVEGADKERIRALGLEYLERGLQESS